MVSESGGNASMIDDLSRALVAEIAPEELDLFPDLAQEYHANPKPPEVTRGGDDPLGFGMEAALIATTPAVMAVVTLAFNFVTQVATDTLKDQTQTFIQEQVKRLFAGKKSGPASLELNPEQITRLRNLAASEAHRFGLKKAEADRLADALAGRLAMNR